MLASSRTYSKELGDLGDRIHGIIQVDQLPLDHINPRRLFLLMNFFLSAFHSCSARITEQGFPPWYHLAKFIVYLSFILKELDGGLPSSTTRLINKLRTEWQNRYVGQLCYLDPFCLNDYCSFLSSQADRNIEENIGYSTWALQLLGYWESLNPSIGGLVNGKEGLPKVFGAIAQRFVPSQMLSPEQDLELGIAFDAVAYILFCVPSVVVTPQMCHSLLIWMSYVVNFLQDRSLGMNGARLTITFCVAPE